MSQWAEVRHMYLTDHVPKKQIARRLGLDVKTVRRALEREEACRGRESPPRGCRLDPHRERIEAWLREDPKLTAKRLGRLLVPFCGPLPPRSLRRYVARVRTELYPKEAFVHRTHRPGDTMEVDFGEAWIDLGGDARKVKFLVATLPASNAYFAKAYRVERLECLLDGIASAFAHFGGVTRRAVLDNTSLAVKRVLKGRDREETDDFHAFRGAYALHVDFCAPAKGNEKGSVETGVRYVRNLVFRPRPRVATLDELNASILNELDADLDARTVAGGRTARQASQAEREHLRPLPAHPPAPCRTWARVADKFGHVRIDRNAYSVPIALAYRDVWAKVYPERIEIAAGDRVVARHRRCYGEGRHMLDPLHVLPLLEIKHRAVSEATALRSWVLPEVFAKLRTALQAQTRKPDREWVKVLRLMEDFPLEEVETAVRAALAAATPRYESVRLLLRGRGPARDAVAPVLVDRDDLATVRVAEPDLEAYDRELLGEGA
ncbi:MAG: IS21 family transposase [Planctomycetota bacterium]|jgi:transposase